MTALEEIVAEFARNVAAQNEAIERGDAQTGNKHARLYIKAFDKLRAEGDVGREALVRLFEHERPDVRAMAAVFLLRYRAEEAKPVLDAVARTQKGLVAFEADQALKRWEETNARPVWGSSGLMSSI